MGRLACIAVAAAFALAVACATNPASKSGDVTPPAVTHLRIKSERGPVQRVALEDYVRGAIVAEFAPASGTRAVVERMLEVQAVVARTYAIAHTWRHASEGYDLCSTVHCQVYKPERLRTAKWRDSIEAAVTRTRGRVLWYGTAPARALFHADCGGHTSAADEVWQGPPRPYLVARKDDGPAASAHIGWRFEIEARDMLDALGPGDRRRIGRLTDIRVRRRDSAGRATHIIFHGAEDVTMPADALRTAITRRFGQSSVRSTRFDIERRSSTYLVTGRGFGHGVGLCQAGAYARLQAGARPLQVLEHYYPGTQLIALR